jgi:catechol 2,3-dioxygenase-like lactoylglutathione lyase family enzyme
MRAVGITHVAVELSSPTRMERWLHDVFGLQLLRQGYWRGEYVRIIGSPHHQQRNPGFLVLYNRPFIPRARLRYIAVGIDEPIEDAVVALRRRGCDVDSEDIVTGPEGLRLKIDSFIAPRPTPAHDPATVMAAADVDTTLPCLWRGVHHMAIDLAHPPAMQRWLCALFGFDFTRTGDRRGEYFHHVAYKDAKRDPVGRRGGMFPIVGRRDTSRADLHHIAFETADSEGAIRDLEAKGVPVDLPKDGFVYAPEELWLQIDSRETPFPHRHPANEPAVTLIPSVDYWKH